MINKVRPNWEKNSSLLEGKHLMPASIIARTIDNSAIEQNRRYTADTIRQVTKQLSKLYPHVEFKVASVSLYVNGVATNKGIVGHDNKVGRWSTPEYQKELGNIRKTLLSIK